MQFSIYLCTLIVGLYNSNIFYFINVKKYYAREKDCKVNKVSCTFFFLLLTFSFCSIQSFQSNDWFAATSIIVYH